MSLFDNDPIIFDTNFFGKDRFKTVDSESLI